MLDFGTRPTHKNGYGLDAGSLKAPRVRLVLPMPSIAAVRPSSPSGSSPHRSAHRTCEGAFV